ncbi:MAG: c-type cytochrome [Rhizorhabdus sp.]
MIGRLSLAAGAAIALASVVPQQVEAQAAPGGDVLFRQRCQTCHQVAAGKPSPIGPNLYGVVNRKAAAAPLPFKYSEALKKSGLTWTRANLDKYLAAPTKMVPGTRMVIALPDAKQRAAVIDYLARAK